MAEKLFLTMSLLAASLISGAAGLLANGLSNIGSVVNNRRREDERKADYNRASAFNSMLMNENPFDTSMGRSLLKLQNERREEQLRGMENRAVAGGATFENQLAARNAINRTDNEVGMRLIQYGDAQRQAARSQQYALDRNYSAGTQANFARQAQDWHDWGQLAGNNGMSLINAGLLLKNSV